MACKNTVSIVMLQMAEMEKLSVGSSGGRIAQGAAAFIFDLVKANQSLCGVGPVDALQNDAEVLSGWHQERVQHEGMCDCVEIDVCPRLLSVREASNPPSWWQESDISAMQFSGVHRGATQRRPEGEAPGAAHFLAHFFV